MSKHPGGRAPESTAPRGEQQPNISTIPPGGNPQIGLPDRGAAAAEALQRLRERLELAALAAGARHPEQMAAALIREVRL